MKKIEEYTPEEVVALTTIIGILISRKFNSIQILVIASILSGVAQDIVISVAQTNLIANPDNLSSTNNDLQKQIDELKKHIKKLEDDKTS